VLKTEVLTITDMRRKLFRHHDGCPVAGAEADTDLGARMEIYRVGRPGLDTRQGRVLAGGTVLVTHCRECGAMSHEG